MLSIIKPTDRFIKNIERVGGELILKSDAGMLRISPRNDEIVRVTYTAKEHFSAEEKPGVIWNAPFSDWTFFEAADRILVKTAKLGISINRQTGAMYFCDSDGNLLLKENEFYSRELEEYTYYEIEDDSLIESEKINTADGEKTVIKSAAKKEKGKLYHTRLWLDWQEDEALFGLGQHEEGFANLRGKMIFVHQGNRKIAVPMLVSALGYGILVDTYSPMIFNDTNSGSYIYTEADPEMDYYFIGGGSPDAVIAGYRKLTGKAGMLPKWAFGYLQSQERYETQDEIIEVAKGYRDRNIGLDGVILDWISWPDGMWGQKSFDSGRFPSPKQMTDDLHDMDVHFMMSIWPNMDEKCENNKEFKEKGLFLHGSTIYNAFREEARKLYWKQVEEALYVHGVDSWWCDSSEPITPEWNRFTRTEPAALYYEYVNSLPNHIPADKTNAFCLYHAKSLYEGQRGSKLPFDKRVLNLTRSGYTGQQRYSTILWSGDVSASWDTLRKQVAAGFNFCASGLPYWTTDIGAFFVKNSAQWYWDGQYDDTTLDYGYRELFTRWYQWESFLPVFRGHGTDCRRELWNFGEPGEMFYDAIVKYNALRYKLMPYIYSLAGMVWLEDKIMIKPLAFAFPDDLEVSDIADQYMFGDDIMVCPVTEPMYYNAGSVPIPAADKLRKVYLPEGCGWYDFYTHKYYEGGQTIEAEADIDVMPVFVREGSIVLMGNDATSTADAGREITAVVFSGKDASFILYEDAGDGYGYEKGEYALTEFIWNENDKKLKVEVKKSSGGIFEAVSLVKSEIVEKK